MGVFPHWWCGTTDKWASHEDWNRMYRSFPDADPFECQTPPVCPVCGIDGGLAMQNVNDRCMAIPTRVAAARSSLCVGDVVEYEGECRRITWLSDCQLDDGRHVHISNLRIVGEVST